MIAFTDELICCFCGDVVIGEAPQLDGETRERLRSRGESCCDALRCQASLECGHRKEDVSPREVEELAEAMRQKVMPDATRLEPPERRALWERFHLEPTAETRAALAESYRFLAINAARLIAAEPKARELQVRSKVLAEAGRLALIESIDVFDFRRGERFAWFATPRIRDACDRKLADLERAAKARRRTVDPSEEAPPPATVQRDGELLKAERVRLTIPREIFMAMKKRDLAELRRRAKKRAKHHTVRYENGKPTPEAEATFRELGVAPSFAGEPMTCEICGRQEQSDPHVNTDWRAIDADGDRAYFCPDEFPPDATATKGQFSLAYQRAMVFVMARRTPEMRAAIAAKGLDRPIDWSK